MKKTILFCAAALAALFLLTVPAFAGGFDVLSAPEIQSLDLDTLAVTWDEPDKPGNENSPNRNGYDDLVPMDNWSCLGWYVLRVYYSDHALTAEEWPESPLKVPASLEKIGDHKLGAKDDPGGVIKTEWLTKGNGYYYFGIVAMTTGGQYLYRNTDYVECASSDIGYSVRIFHTPYVVEGVENLPKPENVRFENGQLRWSYDLQLASQVQFRMDLHPQGQEHRSGYGLYLHAQRDYENKELYVDLTGDYSKDLQPGVTYNLAIWAQSRDNTAYSDSEEVLIEDFLPVSAERLPSPQNVTIDKETLNVTWDPVDDPALMDYMLTVYFDDGTAGPKSVDYLRPQEPRASINGSVLDKGSGTYYVTVRARTNDVTQRADGLADPAAPRSQAGTEAWSALAHASLTVSDTPLPTISLTGTQWGEDSYLRWEPVEGAASYEVRLYRRASENEPYPEQFTSYTRDVPAYRLLTPNPLEAQQVAIKVRAVSANAMEYANGEWSDFSPDYAYSDAPALPGVKKKKYNKDDRTISWEPITGEDAAYVGGYVVEISFSGKDDVGNSISINPGWTVITQGNSVSLDAFSKYYADGVPSGKASYRVWAYSNDLTKRNHGSNNGGTNLPDGALQPSSPAVTVTIMDVQRENGSCSFQVDLTGTEPQDLVFAAVYQASGQLREVKVLNAGKAADGPVTFTGIADDDVIRVMLTDPDSVPLAPVTPVE